MNLKQQVREALRQVRSAKTRLAKLENTLLEALAQVNGKPPTLPPSRRKCFDAYSTEKPKLLVSLQHMEGVHKHLLGLKSQYPAKYKFIPDRLETFKQYIRDAKATSRTTPRRHSINTPSKPGQNTV